MPFRSTARPALALLVLGLAIYFPSYFWIKSRSLTPLDVPMSLSPGHIETGEFQINLEANFFVYADTRIWVTRTAAIWIEFDLVRSLFPLAANHRLLAHPKMIETMPWSAPTSAIFTQPQAATA